MEVRIYAIAIGNCFLSTISLKLPYISINQDVERALLLCSLVLPRRCISAMRNHRPWYLEKSELYTLTISISMTGCENDTIDSGSEKSGFNCSL